MSEHFPIVSRDNNNNTIIIIIMEICKAPILRLKALNKHTHIMYVEMENKYVYIDKCSSIIMQKMHTNNNIIIII